ncbi:extracellular solute-binding protein [Methyloversatilis thermotolerans]|uniref:extracellular solute-binding protein n=1 Tax=Methyloversatilis thermotolerans TaxID=1346290 RepID=UPI001E355E4B|nr:extracellular solute-binding protein [Methyloversatilis thermotolerans]
MSSPSQRVTLEPRCCRWLRRLGALAILCLPAAQALAATVRLAAAEQPPYIGPAHPREGYVAELVRAAFERVGYTVDIRFYPPARARSLAASGQVDGLLPVPHDDAFTPEFALSDPFPGASVGLLKKRSLDIHYPPDAPVRPAETLRGLANLRFGAVRGTSVWSAFDAAAFLKREYVDQDLQNLDKLALGRIDLMLVDKFTASDLMILHRPHLIGQLDFMQPPLFRSDFHIAFARRAPNHERLRADFNRGLAALAREGRVDDILTRHGLSARGPAADGRKVLTVATVNNPDMLTLKTLAAEFTRRHPDVRIEWRVLDETSLRTRLMTDLAIADGQFDVMTIGSYEVPLWAARGWLVPFRDLPPAYREDDLIAPVRESLRHDGVLHALPFYAESTMTYYRTDLFRRAGLTMPAQPSYADIGRLAARLHDPAAGVHGLCLRGRPGWGDNVAVITTMVNTYGGRWFDDAWQPQLDSPEWREAVSTYVDLLRRYGPPDAHLNGFPETLELFARGHCAIWIDATVAAGKLFNAKESRVAASLGFAPAPVERVREGSNWLWIWALAIPASSPNKELARRFIEWATSPEYPSLVAAQAGWVAVPPGTRLTVYDAPAYRAAAPFSGFVRQAIASAYTQLPGRRYTGVQWVGIPEFPAIGHRVGTEIARALVGEQDVDTALRAAQAEVARQMRASGYIRQ